MAAPEDAAAKYVIEQNVEAAAALPWDAVRGHRPLTPQLRGRLSPTVVTLRSRPLQTIDPRPNVSVYAEKKYMFVVRDPADPMSPGTKFGLWGDEGGEDGNPPLRASDRGRVTSRSRSPKYDRLGSPDRYSYVRPTGRAQVDPPYDPYVVGVVEDVDMKPLFNLLDPVAMSGSVERATHARAEAFKMLRRERAARLDAVHALKDHEAQLQKACRCVCDVYD